MNNLFDIRGDKFASVTVADVTFYDLVCGSPVIHFDTLKMSNIEATAETTEITGGQGNATLASINHTKAINLTMEEALVTMSYLAIITGGEVKEAASGEGNAIVITANEEVTEKDGVLALAHSLPVGGTLWLAEVSADGIISERKARFDNTGAEPIQDLPITSESWLPSVAKPVAGGKYRVFYEYELTSGAQELTIFSNVFSKTYRMVGDTTLYNTRTGRNEAFQIEIPRLKLDDSYTLTFDAAGEAAVFTLNGKALADADKRMMVLRLYGSAGTIEDNCIEIPVSI
jgi:hypothetical protein